jgi:hypothetical protein
MSFPIITGLFTENSVITDKMFSEIKTSLVVNEWYKQKLYFLAGDLHSARILESLGLHVHRIFDDAPEHVKAEPLFRMKHWMVYQSVIEFGEVLWVDWDTVSLRPIDSDFIRFCRKWETPKFVYIDGYHATVNCSVYYMNEKWLPAMEASFSIATSVHNDELMWKEVLPHDITEKKEYWLGDFVVNVWLESECAWVTPETYFAHVKTFDYVKHLKKPRHIREYKEKELCQSLVQKDL